MPSPGLFCNPAIFPLPRESGFVILHELVKGAARQKKQASYLAPFAVFAVWAMFVEDVMGKGIYLVAG